jgi:hypothetical protein
MRLFQSLCGLNGMTRELLIRRLLHAKYGTRASWNINPTKI